MFDILWAAERTLDMEGVGGSIPPVPTKVSAGFEASLEVPSGAIAPEARDSCTINVSGKPQTFCIRPAVSGRFWAKVDIGDAGECWEWRAARDTSGYGKFKFEGAIVRASRLAYLFAVGAIAPGLGVLHRCDNRLCCNPTHLFLGTVIDNNRDRARKGRSYGGCQAGACNRAAILDEMDIRVIRRLFRDGLNNTQIAGRYGVHHATISAIRRGKTWTHVPEVSP